MDNPIDINADYSNLLEAYRVTEHFYPIEGDKLSQVNGRLVKINRVFSNRDDETLVPVLQRINESAGTVLQAIEDGSLQLSDDDKSDFFRLRSIFATKMSDLEYLYRKNTTYSQLRPLFLESFRAHHVADYKITSNTPIDFSKEQNLFGRVIPYRRDQSEDISVIAGRITEAKSHLLSKSARTVANIGKHFVFFALYVPTVMLESTLHCALRAVQFFGPLRQQHPLNFYGWADRVSTNLFPGLKADPIAKQALHAYAWELKDESVWDEERFKLFEGVVSYLNKGPDLYLVELRLNEQDFRDLKLSDNAESTSLVAQTITKLGRNISLQEARTMLKIAQRLMRVRESEEDITQKLMYFATELPRGDSDLQVSMTPGQLIRYLQIFKDHTSFRTVKGMDQLVARAERDGDDSGRNALYDRITDLGFTVSQR